MKAINRILFIAIITIVTSCATGNKFAKQHNESSIPADLRSNGHVLLVMQYSGGMMGGRDNRAIRRFMDKHYGAPYEMVTPEQLESNAYSDTNEYRYVIGNSGSGLMVTETNMQTGAGPSRAYTDQVIFDRKANKRLPPTGVLAPSFAAGIKMFAEYMGKNKE
jgi:hypothetical protein